MTTYRSIAFLGLLGFVSLTGAPALADPARTDTPKTATPGTQAPKAEDKLVITRGRHVIYDDGKDDLYCNVRGGRIIGYDYHGRPIHSRTRMRCR